MNGKIRNFTASGGGVLLALALLCAHVHAEDEEARLKGLQVREGEMFTVKYVPGDRTLVVGVVGSPALTAGPDRVEVFGREIFGTGKSRNLAIKTDGQKFSIQSELDPKATIEIDVQDKKTRKRETLKLEMKPRS